MQNFSLPKRLIYKYQGLMLGLIHWTEMNKVLGIKISSFIRWLFFFLPIFLWIRGWGIAFIILGILIFLWVQISYWRARRLGYYRFVSDKNQIMAAENIEPLPKRKHIKVSASGTFSVKDWEKKVVLRPAEYWQVPLGDHGIMVEHQPDRYLYQFFNAETMQELQRGWLLYGFTPRPALAVSFISTWGPEFSDDNISLLRRNNQNPPQKIRTIYLSFADEEQERAVRQNMIYDARQVRSIGEKQ